MKRIILLSLLCVQMSTCMERTHLLAHHTTQQKNSQQSQQRQNVREASGLDDYDYELQACCSELLPSCDGAQCECCVGTMNSMCCCVGTVGIPLVIATPLAVVFVLLLLY